MGRSGVPRGAPRVVVITVRFRHALVGSLVSPTTQESGSDKHEETPSVRWSPWPRGLLVGLAGFEPAIS